MSLAVKVRKLFRFFRSVAFEFRFFLDRGFSEPRFFQNHSVLGSNANECIHLEFSFYLKYILQKSDRLFYGEQLSINFFKLRFS